jgi:hypothetical protein
LKALCHPIMIRRPMSIIALPARQNYIKTVEFSPEERREYQKIEDSLRQPPNYKTSYSSGTHSTMNTFQLINKLRRFCNLGVGSITMPTVSWQIGVTTPKSEVSVDTAVALEVALWDTICKECGQIFDVPNSQSTADSPFAYFSSECCKLYCGSCAKLENYQTTSEFPCCRISSCVLRPLSIKVVYGARNEQPLADIYPAETTKIRSLVQEILDVPLEKQ